MHAEWCLAHDIHSERLRDFHRWSEATAKSGRLRGRPVYASQRGSEAPVPAERLLETSLARFARDAMMLAIRAPSLASVLLRLVRGQRKAARIRAWWKARGTHVPPVLIASITERCNLHCAGCYAMARGCSGGEELPSSRWTGLFGEAARLGVSFVLVAGGEPFSRGEVIGAAGVAPDTLFAVFTNGLLVGPRAIEAVRRSRNVVPIISLEGPQRETDSRRGHGVYRRVMQTMRRLRSARLAAGRGFVHVSSQGRLEPCPYAPISDRSVRDAPLADALRSPLFAAIRMDRGRLAERRGGCALRADRDWVRSLAAPAVEPATPAPRSA